MIAVRSILAAALLAVCAPVAAQAACQLTQIAAIPVVFQRNKPLVDVTINGHKTRMLADTGAGRTILFNHAAEALGLHPVGGNTDFMGVGGTRRAKEVTVADLGFGGSSARNIRLFVVDGRAGEDVAGVFGFDLLGQTTVEFDIGESLIKLFSERDCPRTNLAYWSKEPMVAEFEPSGLEFKIPLLLNGVTIHATLDSGASTSVITSEAARRAHGVLAPADAKIVGGLGAERVETTTQVFASLKVGDEEVKNTKLLAGDYFRATREVGIDSHIKRSVADETEMLLGADFLRSHRVILSPAQKRMYFTYTGGPVFQVVAPAASESAPSR